MTIKPEDPIEEPTKDKFKGFLSSVTADEYEELEQILDEYTSGDKKTAKKEALEVIDSEGGNTEKLFGGMTRLFSNSPNYMTHTMKKIITWHKEVSPDKTPEAKKVVKRRARTPIKGKSESGKDKSTDNLERKFDKAFKGSRKASKNEAQEEDDLRPRKDDSKEEEATDEKLTKLMKGKVKKSESEDDTKVDILSFHYLNVEIYETTPETHPEFFLSFKDQHISRRVIESNNKPTNSSYFPVKKNRLLSDVILELRERPLSYLDLMMLVDQTKTPQIFLTARRLWWSIKYNEFLRFGLGKEETVRGGETFFRLLRIWSDDPIFTFVVDEWKKKHGG